MGSRQGRSDEPDDSAKTLATGSRVEAVFVWGIVATLLAARLHLVTTRLYDPDEFEHLHVAVSMARGLVPYRDFFEHHGPLPYALSMPLAKGIGLEPMLFTANRLLSFAFVLALMPAVWKLAVGLGGVRAGRLALLWLFSMPWFVEKSIEWRPDVPATCLWMWGAVWLLGPPRLGRTFAAGLLVGLASLCTPKIVYLCLGVGLAHLVRLRRWRQPLAAQVVMGVVGTLSPWCLAWLYFTFVSGAEAFLRCVLLLPLQWQTREPFTDFVTATPQYAPGHMGLAILAITASLSRSAWPTSSQSAWSTGEAGLTLALLLHLLAIPFTPAVFLQYYLLGLPVAAILVGVALVRWHDPACPRLRWVPIGAAGMAVAVGSLLRGPEITATATAILHALNLFATPSRPLSPGMLYPAADLAGLLGMLAAAVIALLAWCRRPAGATAAGTTLGRLALGLFWVAVFVPSGQRLALPHILWRNDGQLHDLRLVRQIVPLDQPILDGFTGLGCFHPHTLYWWWINRHSLPLLRSHGGLVEVESALAAGKPAAILFDPELQRLPEGVLRPIEGRYRPTAVHPRSVYRTLVLLRNDLRDPTASPP